MRSGHVHDPIVGQNHLTQRLQCGASAFYPPDHVAGREVVTATAQRHKGVRHIAGKKSKNCKSSHPKPGTIGVSKYICTYINLNNYY